LRANSRRRPIAPRAPVFYTLCLRVTLYIGTAVLALGLLFVLPIMVSSYLGERSDYTRTPPQPASRYSERTGVAGLREMRFTDASGTRLAGWYAPPRNRAQHLDYVRHAPREYPSRVADFFRRRLLDDAL
jgi:hypothetical protein